MAAGNTSEQRERERERVAEAHLLEQKAGARPYAEFP